MRSVSVWFQRDVTNETMVESNAVMYLNIQMLTTSMAVEYDKLGQWVSTTETVDYTKGRAETHFASLAGNQDELSQNDTNQNDPAQQKAIALR